MLQLTIAVRFDEQNRDTSRQGYKQPDDQDGHPRTELDWPYRFCDVFRLTRHVMRKAGVDNFRILIRPSYSVHAYQGE